MKAVKALFKFDAKSSWTKFYPAVYTTVEKTPWKRQAKLWYLSNPHTNKLLVDYECETRVYRDCHITLHMDAMEDMMDYNSDFGTLVMDSLMEMLTKITSTKFSYTWLPISRKLILEVNGKHYTYLKDGGSTTLWGDIRVYVRAQQILPFYKYPELEKIVAEYSSLITEFAEFATKNKIVLFTMLKEYEDLWWATELNRYITTIGVVPSYYDEEPEKVQRKYKVASQIIENILLPKAKELLATQELIG